MIKKDSQHGSKKTLSSKAGRLTGKKKLARTTNRPASADGFKVDRSPAARAFGKAVSITHRRLYGVK